MPRDPKEAVAAALAEQAPDDDDLRDWLTDRAEFVLDALAADDFRVVDGRAVQLDRSDRETSSVRWLAHNLIAHPLLGVAEWFHNVTAPRSTDA